MISPTVGVGDRETYPDGGPAISGLVVPMVTPMAADGSVDYCSVGRLASHFAGQPGVSGIMTTSRVGEGLALTSQEQIDVARTVVSVVSPDLPVFAAMDTRTVPEALRQLDLLAKVGVACVMVLPPLWLAWGRVPGHVIVDFYSELSEPQPLPLLLFQVPVRSYWIHPDTIMEIAQLRRVVGMKEGSFEPSLFAATMRALRPALPDFRVFNGNDRFVVEAAAAGCDGAILGVSNIFPTRWATVIESATRGAASLAADQEDELSRLTDLLFRDPILAAVARIKVILAELKLIREPTVRGRALGIGRTEAIKLLEEYARAATRSSAADRLAGVGARGSRGGHGLLPPQDGSVGAVARRIH